jgi:hypothetical protein
MGDALIKYRKSQLWLRESFVEVLSEYISIEFEKKTISEYSTGLQKIYKVCIGNKEGIHIGMVDIPFDIYLNGSADEEAMIDLLSRVKTELQSKGEKIEIEELNAIENRKVDDDFKSLWKIPVYVSSFVATIDCMIKMLNGEWTSTNHGVWFKGFAAPDGVELV